MTQAQTAVPKDETRTVSPPVSIGETEKAVILQAEMPGLDRESIGLELSGDELVVKGHRKQDDVAAGYTAVLRERCPLEYTRAFRLGAEVSREGIGASYENGVLTVTIPKAESRQPKRIEIGD